MEGEDGESAAAPLVAREFQDDRGRIWRAAFSRVDDEGVLEFECPAESREPKRAILMPATFSFADVTDKMLREWLSLAPRIARLSE